MKKAFALFLMVMLAGCLGSGTGDFGSDGDVDADTDSDGDGDTVDPRCEGEVALCPYPDAVGTGGVAGDIVGNREWPGSGPPPEEMIALAHFWEAYLDGATVLYAHRYCQT